jgi:glycosyltransferase involved in cell wall biosynthesis
VSELPIGVDEKLFTSGSTSIRSALGWTAQHTVMGYVGRLAYVKGIDLLAAAFHDISQSLTNARLLIIGSGEEEKKARLILANELARGAVHIESDVDHERLPQWYRAMDFLVMPSRYENFSNAVLEAMACGIPILASNVGGNKLIEEVGSGWLFQANSLSSLDECLGRMLGKPGELKARGIAGSRYVQERYSWTASAACLEGIIGRRLGVKI